MIRPDEHNSSQSVRVNTNIDVLRDAVKHYGLSSPTDTETTASREPVQQTGESIEQEQRDYMVSALSSYYTVDENDIELREDRINGYDVLLVEFSNNSLLLIDEDVCDTAIRDEVWDKVHQSYDDDIAQYIDTDAIYDGLRGNFDDWQHINDEMFEDTGYRMESTSVELNGEYYNVLKSTN